MRLRYVILTLIVAFVFGIQIGMEMYRRRITKR